MAGRIEINELIDIGLSSYGKLNGVPDFARALQIYMWMHENPSYIKFSDIQIAATAWQNEFKQIVDLTPFRAQYP